MVLAVAATFVVAGVGASTISMVPLLAGDEAAYERSLSRGSVALGVRVMTFDENEAREPAAGATIALFRPAAEDSPEPVATATTNERGIALLEVRPGHYRIVVTFEEMVGKHDLTLRSDTRLGVVFDAEGEAHFIDLSRRDVERNGEMAALLVRVGQAGEESRHDPIANATVTVSRIRSDGNGSTSLEEVAEKLTGPRGFAAFYLHKGAYAVTVEFEELEGTVRVALRSDQGLAIFFDENGTAHVRSMDAPRGEDGEAIHLGVTVTTAGSNGTRNVGGAHVAVYRIDQDGSSTPVARGETGPRGHALFTLRPGNYTIEAQKGDLSGSADVELTGDQRLEVQVS